MFDYSAANLGIFFENTKLLSGFLCVTCDGVTVTVVKIAPHHPPITPGQLEGKKRRNDK
jgi:hypothetical protein